MSRGVGEVLVNRKIVGLACLVEMMVIDNCHFAHALVDGGQSKFMGDMKNKNFGQCFAGWNVKR